MTLQDAVVFLRDQATLEDLKTIREVFALRLRQLQRQGAKVFQLNEQVLFVADGVEQLARVVRISRRFVVICLGNQRHVRCDASFLKKIPPSEVTTKGNPTASTCSVR